MRRVILKDMHKDKIRDSLKKAYSLRSAMSLHGWDQETFMPVGGGASRSVVLAELGAILHQEMTRPDLLIALQDELVHASSNSGWAACVRAYLKDCERKSKIPPELDKELNSTASLAQQAWSLSRTSGNTEAFLPHLEKLIGLKRQEVACLATANLKGYDVLLDSFEPGMRTEMLDPVFSRLHEALTEILGKIQTQRGALKESRFTLQFPKSAQEAYSRDLLARIGFNLENGRLDASAHPFTEGVAPNDIRLTTRYSTDNFLDSFYTVLHEGGHGLYEQGFSEEWRWTPLAEAVSLGVHESQSRFWENCIGRSRAFWEGELPQARKFFPGVLDNASVETILQHALAVRPSLIRVESDEVTYNLHILLRYRIERALFSGNLQVQDLECAWNTESANLLGLEPNSPREGYLQDVHWSAGLFGYFPTYALGNLYSAQLLQTLEKNLPDFWSQIRSGQFKNTLNWLRTHVHQHGRRFTATELMAKATGSELSEEPFLQYLRQKYLD